jgi:hemerythrin
MDDNQQEYLEELVEFLVEWLINHIQKMDKKIPKVN